MPCPGSAQPPPDGPPPSRCVAGCKGAGLSCCTSKLRARLGGSLCLRVNSRKLDRDRTICPPKVAAVWLVVQPGLPAAAFRPADPCRALWRRQEGGRPEILATEVGLAYESCVKETSWISPSSGAQSSQRLEGWQTAYHDLHKQVNCNACAAKAGHLMAIFERKRNRPKQAQHAQSSTGTSFPKARAPGHQTGTHRAACRLLSR